MTLASLSRATRRGLATFLFWWRLRRTASQYDDMAANWPSEAARYSAEAKRLRDDADWYLATLRRATHATGGENG